MFTFAIDRDALLASLLLVSGAVEKKQTLPILGNVLIKITNNQLRLCATDTELSVSALLPIETVEQAGEITVPAKKFIDICRSLNEGVLINVAYKEGRVLIKAGRSRFSLTTLPATDFPVLIDESKDVEFQVEKEPLVNLLQATHFCMAQQDVRYYLNGLLLEFFGRQINAVSTDGHRLAIGQLDIDNTLPEYRLILPRKGVLELLRLLNDVDDDTVSVSVNKNHFYLQTKQYDFASKLIEGRFPNYRRVVPVDNDKAIVIERDPLKRSLSRVSILANEKYRAVQLSVSPKTVTIVASNQEQEEAQEELEADTEGDSISIGLNASYLLDVLNNVPPGNVNIAMSEPTNSILVTSPLLPIAKYVIMPLKI
jgi:DNA polymerase-3 subunit beta